MMIKDNIKDLFLMEAIEHGKSLAIGDYKKANRHHKKIVALYNKAKVLNIIDLFAEMLDEPDENVRLWAATFTLSIYPDKGDKALKKLSELTSITGLSAQTTLNLWKKGMLDLL